MALIQTIRNNSWILIIFIALGLIGFLMMDMGGGNAPQGPTSQSLGEVNGQAIDYNEFNTAERLFYGNQSNNFSNKKTLWDYFLQRNLANEEAQDLGLGVGEEEKNSLLFGPEISPVIQNQFVNPATGQIDMQRINNFRQRLEAGELDPEQERNWNYFAQTAVEDKVQTKIRNIVRKSVYSPSWMVEMKNKEQNDKYSIAYTNIPYSDITAISTEVSDSDIKNYISENSSQYTREEELRRAQYIFFEARPTPEDSAILRNQLDTLRVELGAIEKDSAFTLINRGTFGTRYVESSAIDPFVADQLETSEAGATFGPYIQNGSYKIQKLVKKRILRDSVRVRHIAIGVPSQEQLTATHSLVDSLKEVLEAGTTSFDDIAVNYSQDSRSSENGGDLGYVTSAGFGPTIDNLILYKAEVGKIYKSYSQTAIHLVEVLDVKNSENMGYRMASIAKPIIPSTKTQDRISEKAYNFMYANRDREAFEQAVFESNEVTLLTSEDVDINGYTFGILGESQTSREIVKWMFQENTTVGTVAGNIFTYSDPVNYYRKYFVVPVLDKILKPGMASVEDVRGSITPIIVNQKKAQWAVENHGSSTIAAIASQYGTQADTASSVVFSRAAISGLGTEPDVVAALTTMNEGETKCVGGNAGIVCMELLSKSEASPVANMPQFRQVMSMTDENVLPQAVFDAMKEGAKIEDNRSSVF